MKSSNFALPLLVAAVLLTMQSAAQAQRYYYRSDASQLTPQSRVIVGEPHRIYSNNAVRYRSLRPNYASPQVYSNGRYYTQPNSTYYSTSPTYYRPQLAPQYFSSGNSNQVFYANQPYWNQPTATYHSNYGTGYYSSPQQYANANAGAVIGGAIGGNQGAQVGAAIGATIRP